jgi:hypothetical protein
MNTNEPTIIVYPDTPLEDIVKQLDELGLLVQPKPVQIEFRWYYDNNGTIYSTCNNLAEIEMYNLTGEYIIVDESIFYDFVKYRVVGGKPELITNPNKQRVQLEKGNPGYQVVKNNAALLLESGEDHMDTEQYGYKNN